MLFLRVISLVAIVTLFMLSTEGVSTWNSGAGKVYTLSDVKDISLESGVWSHYGRSFLMVAYHRQYPKKRFLIQFENLPKSCPASRIKWAKMYLYFWYAHKPSWHNNARSPYIDRPLEVYMVKKYWKESQANSYYRYRGARWSSRYLDIKGRDADPSPLGHVTMYSARPGGWVEFDVTWAVKMWRQGAPNYGLLVKAANEEEPGRDRRFKSKYSKQRPFVRVMCV